MVLQNEPIVELELPDDYNGLKVGILNRTGLGTIIAVQRKAIKQDDGTWLVVIELVNPPEPQAH